MYKLIRTNNKIIQFIIVTLVLLILFSNTLMAETISIRVGVYDNQPKIYVEDGIAQGFWADITNYIAAQENWQVDYIHGSWAEGLERLENNEIDLMVDVAVTDTRKQIYDFTNETVLVSWSEIYSSQDSDIESFFDLRNKRIGVLNGSVNYLGERGIKQVLDDFDINVSYVVFESYDEVFAGVQNGSADVGVTNNVFGGANYQKYDLKQTPILFRPSEISYGLPKNASLNQQLIDAIDNHIEKLKSDSSSLYYTSFSKHFYGVQEQPTIQLTEEELEWLQQHPIINVSSEYDWPPFDFVENNISSGLSIDFIRLLGKKIGINFQFVQGVWADLLAKFIKREIDIIHPGIATEERKNFTLFLPPHISLNNILVVRDTDRITTNLSDLIGRRVAVIKDWENHLIIERYYPDIELVMATSPLDALTLVSENKADAYVDNLIVVEYLIKKHFIGNLKILYDSEIPEFELMQLHIGVRNDWPILYSILDKAMESVTVQEMEEIYSKWGLTFKEYSTKFELNSEEEVWLEGHKDIRLGVDPNWPPFEYFNELGVYQGIGYDYVFRMNNLLNVSMIPVEDLSWTEAIELGKIKEVDVFPVISRTPERSEFLLFTDPHTVVPMVLVTKSDTPLISNLTELNGKKVAVAEGYITHEYLERDYPLIELVLVDTIEEGLHSIENGEAVGIVDNILSINYAMQRLGFEDYKVSLTTPYTFDLRFGVRNDWPELVEILNKALNSITEGEKASINSKWTTAFVEIQIDWGYIWMIALGIIAIASLFISFFIFWNRKLSKEISARKNVETALKDSEKKFRDLVENIKEDYFIYTHNPEGRFTYISPSITNILGYNQEEFLDHYTMFLTNNPINDEVVKHTQLSIKGIEQPPYQLEIYHKDGSIHWLEVNEIPVRNNHGEVIEVEGVAHDVTKLKEFDKAKEVFIASMSHELRTPLNSIIGFTTLLLMEKAGELNEEQKKQLDMVKSSSEHLLSLINNVMDVSKTRVSQIDIEKREFDLTKTLIDLIKIIEPLAKVRDIEILTNLSESLIIESDERRIKQVILNLLGNAIKFTKKGLVELSVVQKDNVVEISVRDTGRGIRQGEMSSLFKSFSKLDTSTDGAGLGLYVSRIIANALGGGIIVESEFGKGSTFTLKLPIKYGGD